VKVNVKVKVDTSFGVTIITKLSESGMDLSNSYMFFRNKGSVSAGFVLDALAAVEWESGDRVVAGLSDYPGLTVTVPGIMTLGPDFKLVVVIEAEIVIAAHVDANMELAAWDVRETFPVGSGDYNSKADANPSAGSSYLPSPPTVKASLESSGQITAHLKPTFSFGITFLPRVANTQLCRGPRRRRVGTPSC
jgi:chitinase